MRQEGHGRQGKRGQDVRLPLSVRTAIIIKI